MTLPFRRRHHDDDAMHDRARALTSRELLEPLAGDESAWLAGHLDACAECRRDREAWLADQRLLRSLRDNAPEPPRDLWARTAAALDREPRSRRAAAGRPGERRRRAGGRRAFPLGAAAGVLILVAVIGSAIAPAPAPQASSPGGSAVAIGSPDLAPTPITVDAANVSWIRPRPDGSWELVVTDIDAVCPFARTECRPLEDDGPGRPLSFTSAPSGVTISPDQNQLVVISRGDSATPGKILVVPVPDNGPAGTPRPATAAPASAQPGTPEPPTREPATPEPATAEPLTPEPATPEPATPEPASPDPTPESTPVGQIEIASDVTVVGEAAYSPDGRWLAFSARPGDGSTGADLYLWQVGAPSAMPVTTDHATYFSAWLGGRVLASRVEVPGAPEPATGAPTGEPHGSAEPAASVEATASAAPSPARDARARSFLLDPETLATVDLGADVWLPVVDPTERFVTYWSGTVSQLESGEWQLGTGQLVLDGWTAPEPPSEPDPDATAEPTADGEPGPGGSEEPAASADAGPAGGPAGTPTAIVEGDIAAFTARFDPTGTRLAVWVGEEVDTAVGRLHLAVLDPDTGAVDPDATPLPGAPALRRFSIDTGRLAWVSPRGQDGEESAVQVLGWSSHHFGEIKTLPARELYIVR